MPDVGASPGAILVALFLLIVGDSTGVPVPGDSALIVAGGLAADGQVALPAVIVVASIAAFCADLIVFEVGRRGGRRLLLRDGRFAARRRATLARADAWYARYGLATVFVGKFIPGVRAVGALTAGAAGMSRRGFAIVNAFACLSWSSLVASVAYAAGPTGALAIAGAGIALAAAAIVVGLVRARGRRRRAERSEPALSQTT